MDLLTNRLGIYFICSMLFLSLSMARDPLVGLKNQNPASRILADTTLGFGGFPKLGLENVAISGTLDFVSFYRNLPSGYPGLSTPNKNIEFTPYASASNFSGNYYRQPLLNLVLSAKTSERSSFAIEYAMSHFYTGLSGDSTRKLSIQNMLQLHGYVSTGWGSISLTAGGGALNYSMSPLTIFNKDFREPMFEKLPWDWYTQSFVKYQDLFHSSTTTGSSPLSNSATQGFILEAKDLPGKFGVSGFYGRSNFTVTPDRALNQAPSQLMASRLYKGNDSSGLFSCNVYNQFGYIDQASRVKDNKQIITGEYLRQNGRHRFHVETGGGRVINPGSKRNVGYAFSVEYALNSKKINLPICIKAYYLDKNMAAMEAAYLNSNPSVIQGGYGADPQYNNAYYPSYLQEVNMMVNNRKGLIMKAEKECGNIRVEVGDALSQELENLSNTVSFQHMANAFTRSRFRPWIQNTGPYQMISYRYRRTLQTLQVTDTSNYLKKYNAADLSIKYKGALLGKKFILVNYNYFGSVGKVWGFTPSLNNKKLLNTFFEEISGYWQVHPKFTFLMFYNIQWAKASENTMKNTETNLALDQKSKGWGLGFDYDFSPQAGLFLRHRWISHKDKAFVLDRFKGQETIVELKIFF